MFFRSKHFAGNGRLRLAASNSPVLKKGEAGHPVRLVQQALLDLDYKLPTSTKLGTPDGIYGSETRKVVHEFQTDEKLPAKDGIVGEQTLTRMDALLFSKKIAFRPLPPLPPGSPGLFTHDDLNAREAVLETLSVNPLKSSRFSINFDDTVRKGRAGASVRIKGSVIISGSHYDRIAQAVFDDDIAVQLQPGLTVAGLYIPHVPATMTAAQRAQFGALGLASLPPSNSFVFQRPMNSRAIDDQTVVIHEATHAVCDLQAKGAMNAFFAEMVATVAEAMFRRKKGNAITPTAMAATAAKVAEQISKGNDPAAELSNLAAAMGADPHHQPLMHGTYNYSGI